VATFTIAYQVFGSGPVDLVVAPGFVSHIENYWDQPDSLGGCSGWAASRV
jgi:hypothetical protein